MKPKEGRETLTTAGRQQTWIARYKPDLGIRFYSSSTDAVRARRPTDLVLLSLLAGATLGLVSLFAPDPTTVDRELTRFIGDLPGLLGWFWEILVLAGILVVVAIVVAIAVPRFRRPIAARLAEARPALRVVRSPVKLAGLIGGNFVAQLLLAVILGFTVIAFGQNATMAELLLVNTLVSLFAGFMPVPGEIGVSEAALSFCLVAIGIPESVAIAIAVVYRLLTFYLPPIWGGSAMRWLKRHDYL